MSTTPGSSSGLSSGTPDLLARCARFVYEESELLDSAALDRWLDLFDDESIYWLPMEAGATTPLDELNLVYDDRPRLGDRVARLQSGFAFSESPESRTSHLLSNLRLLDAAEYAGSVDARGLGEGEVALAARGTVARLRRGECDHFHLKVVWALRPDGESFKIRMKRVDLLNAREPLPVLTFLL